MIQANFFEVCSKIVRFAFSLSSSIVLPVKGSLDNGVNNPHIKRMPRCFYL